MSVTIAQRLRDAAESLTSDRVSMRAMAQAHGPEAHGTLLLLMAAPCLLPVPGVGTILGLGMVALAMAMWRGHTGACLPRQVAELELSRPWAQRVLRLLAAAYAMAGRYARHRMGHLTAPGQRSWTAVTVGLMALIVVLPIPFGNVLPALAMMLIGLGLVFRDGVAMLIGMVTAGLATLFTGGLMFLAWDLGSAGLNRLLAS